MRVAILDGIPHAGKTTVLDKLSNRGYRVIDEAETPMVQRWADKYGSCVLQDCLHDLEDNLIKSNYARFKALVGENQAELIREMEGIAEENEIVYQDRSAISWIAFCKLREAEVPLILIQLAEKQKAEFVFFHESVPFDVREERGSFMTEDDAKKVEGLIRIEYEIRGYNLIGVPAYEGGSLDESVNRRIELILSITEHGI